MQCNLIYIVNNEQEQEIILTTEHIDYKMPWILQLGKWHNQLLIAFL